jgi:hypothetical protein
VVRKQVAKRLADYRVVVRDEDTPSDYHASNIRASGRERYTVKSLRDSVAYLFFCAPSVTPTSCQRSEGSIRSASMSHAD